MNFPKLMTVALIVMAVTAGIAEARDHRDETVPDDNTEQSDSDNSYDPAEVPQPQFRDKSAKLAFACGISPIDPPYEGQPFTMGNIGTVTIPAGSVVTYTLPDGSVRSLTMTQDFKPGQVFDQVQLDPGIDWPVGVLDCGSVEVTFPWQT